MHIGCLGLVLAWTLSRSEIDLDVASAITSAPMKLKPDVTNVDGVADADLIAAYGTYFPFAGHADHGVDGAWSGEGAAYQVAPDRPA